MSSLDRQNIRIFARYLFEMEGRPQGRAKEHWLDAERQLSENLFQDNRPFAKKEKAKLHEN